MAPYSQRLYYQVIPHTWPFTIREWVTLFWKLAFYHLSIGLFEFFRKSVLVNHAPLINSSHSSSGLLCQVLDKRSKYFFKTLSQKLSGSSRSRVSHQDGIKCTGPKLFTSLLYNYVHPISLQCIWSCSMLSRFDR